MALNCIELLPDVILQLVTNIPKLYIKCILRNVHIGFGLLCFVVFGTKQYYTYSSR